jgi:hypothetical protein
MFNIFHKQRCRMNQSSLLKRNNKYIIITIIDNNAINNKTGAISSISIKVSVFNSIQFLISFKQKSPRGVLVVVGILSFSFHPLSRLLSSSLSVHPDTIVHSPANWLREHGNKGLIPLSSLLRNARTKKRSEWKRRSGSTVHNKRHALD